MDWTSLGLTLVKTGAPMLASLFLGPEAGPLVSVVINKLSGALGVAPTPEAIQGAIQGDPAAAAKVQAVEAEHADTIQAYLQDVQNARATTVQLAQTGSSIAYGSVVVSIIVTVGFFGLLTLLLYAHLDDASTRVQAVVTVVIGTLGAAFTQVCNYWLGSTSNSKNRMDQIAAIAQTAVGPSSLRRK